MNAEGEPNGQSCPRQTAKVFFWVLFQTGVGFEGEFVSERVSPQAFFTGTQTQSVSQTDR